MQSEKLDITNAETVTHENEAIDSKMILEIFVASHCNICEYSKDVYENIRHRFPSVSIRMISVDQPGAEVPESVFATPTYLLNGRIWSLGNPSQAQIEQTFAASPQSI